MKIFGLRLNQFCFLVSGLGVLVSLPWIGAWGAIVWLAAKAVFLAGVILVLLNK